MVYGFENVDDALDLLPMAARRALDHAGFRMSLDAWKRLPLAGRRELVAVGAEARVDVERVRAAAEAAIPRPEVMSPVDDPSADSVPAEVARALGNGRSIPDAVWSSLSPLGRYALAKVARKGPSDRMTAAYAEIVGHSAVSSHIAPAGGVRMVSVGHKPETLRRAVAESAVTMNEDAFSRLKANDVPKGDVLATARVAGILAAKKTPELIPLCHSVQLTHVSIDFELDEAARSVRIVAAAEAADRTGVEMEALVAASVAGLSVYDMLKSVDRAMTIGPTFLRSKSGGRSGDYER